MSKPSEADTGTGESEHNAVRPADIFFYAPLGALFESVDQVNHLAQLGRERAEGTIRNARFLGQMTAQLGRSEWDKRVGGFLARRGRHGDASSRFPRAESDDTAEPPSSHEDGDIEMARADAVTTPPAVIAPRQRHGSGDSPTNGLRPTVSLAIPDYDTLSASQVVRRLEGLSAGELRAVVHYESTTRSRRTILSRAEQLLGPHAPEAGQAGSSSETTTA